MSPSSVDRRLAELAERTAVLGPRAGFRARTLAALAERAKASLRVELVRSARFFVPGAFVVALVALGLASGTGDASSTDIAVAEQHWEYDF